MRAPQRIGERTGSGSNSTATDVAVSTRWAAGVGTAAATLATTSSSSLLATAGGVGETPRRAALARDATGDELVLEPTLLRPATTRPGGDATGLEPTTGLDGTAVDDRGLEDRPLEDRPLEDRPLEDRPLEDRAARDASGADAIGVNGESHHLWFDHLDVSDGSDGNLDITEGSDFVTVSWSKFHYSTRRTDPEAGATGHRFSNLIGGSDREPLDVGRLNVTWHHVWWADNVDQRMPRTRRGQIHVFNSLYTSEGNSYCTDAGFEARFPLQYGIKALTGAQGGVLFPGSALEDARGVRLSTQWIVVGRLGLVF